MKRITIVLLSVALIAGNAAVAWASDKADNAAIVGL
jgi:hypothetical protein